MDWQKLAGPVPATVYQRKPTNWTALGFGLMFAVLVGVGLMAYLQTIKTPYGEYTQQPLTNATTREPIVVQAVLQLPTATATSEPTPTNTPKPSALDKYGSCGGRKGGSVCVNPTFTPLPGMMPVLDGTPTRLPICDKVDENVVCIVPTIQPHTEAIDDLG